MWLKIWRLIGAIFVKTTVTLGMINVVNVPNFITWTVKVNQNGKKC